MKLLLVAFFWIALNASCSKNSSNLSVYDTGLQGKWNVVMDSFYTGAGISNHLEAYSGNPGDFYDFRADSKLYIFERIGKDTTTYEVDAGDKITIPLFGGTINNVMQVSAIDTLTSHALVITSPKLLSPGGIFWRKVILSR